MATACRNGASPKDCSKTCMTSMCHGVKEAVMCHADPCNNCAVTFMGLVSKTEVRCKSKMADQDQAKPGMVNDSLGFYFKAIDKMWDLFMSQLRYKHNLEIIYLFHISHVDTLGLQFKIYN